jgi:hypothetical protein
VDEHLAPCAPLEALEICVARRGGIDYPSATDGRACAQHHAVTARRDDGRIKPKLGEPSCPNHTREHRCRPMMDEHAWWNRRELL